MGVNVNYFQCADQLNVDYTPIATCSERVEGDVLLVGYGDRTHALTPKITFVPTIVYDGVSNQHYITCVCF